jgi:RNA polymerase sigma-70 factor (ECF subfamily)
MWTAVVEAREGQTPAAMQALEQLARAYWRPLYVFLRQRGRDHENASEEVQGFFVHLLGRDFLRFVQPREGRFRTFLLASFTRWLDDQRDRANAAKRGGGQTLIPLQEFDSVNGLAPSDQAAPEEAFDRRWAREVFDTALARLAEAWEERAELFLALRTSLTSGGEAEEYAAIGARLGMNEGAVKKAAFDLRAKFARIIREEVRRTVRDDAAVDEELRYLIKLLRQ